MRNKQSFIAALVALATGLAATACTKNEGDQTNRSGPDSFKITLHNPTDLGSPTRAVTDTNLVFDVEALDDGRAHDNFSGNIYAYIFFENTLTPSHNVVRQLVSAGGGAKPVKPLATIQMSGGWAKNQTIDLSQNGQQGLPPVYGPTALWVEDAQPDDNTSFTLAGSYATGASDLIYYTNPRIDQVRTPLNPTDPLYNTDIPLANKEATITNDTPGAGKLVVTAVFPQAFNVLDLAHPDFGGIYVYAFSVPTVSVGSLIQSMSGEVDEFNGYTELSFPTYQPVTGPDGNPVPPEPGLVTPFVVTEGQFQDQHYMEARESELIEVDNGKVCPLGSYDPQNPNGNWVSWQKYGQWTLDLGQGCDTGEGVSISSRSSVPSLDFSKPVDAQGNPIWGATIPKIVGVAQNIAGISATSGSYYSFFIINVRDINDIACSFQGCAGH
jgi:hypothetical protein